SITIDGISLTINVCQKVYFEVNIIPETGGTTTLLDKKPGDMVNIETDLIARYIENLLLKEKTAVNNDTSSAINMEMLEQFGFGSNLK
ncbi:MAG: riboflavin synthase, partial [Deltaproteobacteria bacterium]|nr:riboflavin synthase [Deltaproteobacteria bacterium]